MNPKLLTALDKVLDDVIEVLDENGWEDEAAWYDELRAGLKAQEPGSSQFAELLLELERSFLGFGTFTDIPLAPQLAEASDAVARLAAIETHRQRLGLASCASGVIREIKKSVF